LSKNKDLQKKLEAMAEHKPGDPITALGDHMLGNRLEAHVKQIFWAAVAVTTALYYFTDPTSPGLISTYVYSNSDVTSWLSMLPIYGNPNAAKTFITWWGIMWAFFGLWPNGFAKWAEMHYGISKQTFQISSALLWPCFGTLLIDPYQGLFWVCFGTGFSVACFWGVSDINIYRSWAGIAKWNLFFLGWAANTVTPISNFYHAKLVCAYIFGWAAFHSLGLRSRPRAQA
jgi:hypothetical protein